MDIKIKELLTKKISDKLETTDIGDDSILKELKLEIPDEIVLGRHGGIKEIEEFINIKRNKV